MNKMGVEFWKCEEKLLPLCALTYVYVRTSIYCILNQSLYKKIFSSH